MPRRILVAIDDSEESDDALAHAFDVHADDEFVVLHVINPDRWISAGDDEEGELYYSAELEESIKRAADDLLAEAAGTAREAGIDAETVRVFGQPAAAILEYVEENPVDQIVMGSRGRTGLDRLLLGSVAERVVRRSPVPVTVVR